MPELKNFGAVFTHAIGMETAAQDYYAKLDDDARAAAAKKRIDKLERARREYVVEITLEPIDGLDSDNYPLPTQDTSEAGQAQLAETLRAFYTDAAPKINVRQAQRVLEKCGKSVE